MELEIKNLNKKVGNFHILKNINLQLEKDNINVLIGPNGAGKTTLLRIVALLDTPTFGEIFYNGKSSKNLDKLSLRRKIGFVFQNPIILGGTVYQNVVYGLKWRKLKINKDKVKDVLSRVGLLHKINYDAKKLSGGEKQRLQLARVLVIEPDLFLLDEPTANLDPQSTKKVEEIILELVKLKKTIILSTHNLVQARKFGKKIFFLKDGEILQSGEKDEIFKTPTTLDLALFSSSENIIPGRISKEKDELYLETSNLKINVVSNIFSGEVVGIIRPEDILISKVPLVSSARNCLRGKILNIENLGIIYSVVVDCNGVLFTSFVTKQSAASLKVMDDVYIIFKATSVYILPKDS